MFEQLLNLPLTFLACLPPFLSRSTLGLYMTSVQMNSRIGRGSIRLALRKSAQARSAARSSTLAAATKASPGTWLLWKDCGCSRLCEVREREREVRYQHTN